MGCAVSSKEKDVRNATVDQSVAPVNLEGDDKNEESKISAPEESEIIPPELEAQPAPIEPPDIAVSTIDETVPVVHEPGNEPQISLVIYDKDVLSAAELLELDPTVEGELMWIAERFAHATVSPPWVTFVDQARTYPTLLPPYPDSRANETIWRAGRRRLLLQRHDEGDAVGASLPRRLSQAHTGRAPPITPPPPALPPRAPLTPRAPSRGRARRRSASPAPAAPPSRPS
jgi:hypothetical protein